MTAITQADAEVTISPLTFLQTYQSADTVISTLIEKDANFRRWFVPSPGFRQLGRHLLVPLYYHLTTSGYGALVGNDLVGWMYLRGWHQVIYIDTLATHPAWQRKGIATALLRFAERQARGLSREWMALTVKLDNEAALRLCENEGFERGHWHVMEHPGELKARGQSAEGAILRPVYGLAAENSYRQFMPIDESAGEAVAADAMIRLSDTDPYHQPGRDWMIEIQGQAAGYLNIYLSEGGVCAYLATLPEWWGKPEITNAALGMIVNLAKHQPVLLRLGSSGHHRAARQVWAEAGFVEHPAITTRLFKHLAPD